MGTLNQVHSPSAEVQDIRIPRRRSYLPDGEVFACFFSHAMARPTGGVARLATALVRASVAFGMIALLVLADFASSPATLVLLAGLVALGRWSDVSKRGLG